MTCSCKARAGASPSATGPTSLFAPRSAVQLGVAENVIPEAVTSLLQHSQLVNSVVGADTVKLLTSEEVSAVAKEALPFGKLVLSGYTSRILVVITLALLFPKSAKRAALAAAPEGRRRRRARKR